MSYATLLATVFGKRPITLFRFSKGGEERFWTSRDEDLTEAKTDVFDDLNWFSGDDWFNRTWVSHPIRHSRFRNTGSIKRAEVDFILPGSDAWGSSYWTETGYEDNSVIIYHQYVSDPERITRFRGRVIVTSYTLSRSAYRIVLKAENRFTELRRKGLAVTIQRPCRHALYHSRDGLGCGADLASFKISATLSALASNVATVAEAASQADGYYSGGMIIWNGKRQLITKHSGYTLTLLGPIPGMATALAAASPSELSVEIAPGCDLSRQVCNDRFNALEWFGGFPWADETPYDGKTLF